MVWGRGEKNVLCSNMFTGPTDIYEVKHSQRHLLAVVEKTDSFALNNFDPLNDQLTNHSHGKNILVNQEKMSKKIFLQNGIEMTCKI